MTLPKPRYFSNPKLWRQWLRKYHAARTEMWLTFHKQKFSRGMTYDQALDEALCYGWIDVQVRGIDDQKYMMRFVPRRPGSHWTKGNRERAKRLIKAKKMTMAGRRLFSI